MTATWLCTLSCTLYQQWPAVRVMLTGHWVQGQAVFAPGTRGCIQLSTLCNVCQQIAANLGSQSNAQPGARQSPHSKWVTSSWSFVPFFLLLRWRLQGPCCLQGRRRQLQLLPASWICPGTPITRTCRSARRWVPSRLGLKELCIVLGKCECGEQSMMCRLMRVAWSQPCPVHPGASNAEHQALVQRSWLLA